MRLFVKSQLTAPKTAIAIDADDSSWSKAKTDDISVKAVVNDSPFIICFLIRIIINNLKQKMKCCKFSQKIKNNIDYHS